MSTISPINASQENLVIDKTSYFIDQASSLFGRQFKPITIHFKLTGRAAGMYHFNRGKRYIRYNPYIFAKYFEDNLENTVPHEVAHYVADILYGIKNIRPHGLEWQHIMRQFGVEAKVHCDYDLHGIPQRQHRRFTYQCLCNTYQITTRRHNMIQQGKRLYKCPGCNSKITISSQQ